MLKSCKAQTNGTLYNYIYDDYSITRLQVLGTNIYQNMVAKLSSILVISKRKAIYSRNFKVRTRVGKIFSAARLGTEKPPCVLVSLAVKVLQKKSVGCRFGVPISGAINRSFSCYKVPKEK